MKIKRQSGFTLIELLVVISIIAVLASIAVPVFGRVQRKGKQTKALSNARQIGMACKLYAQDYNGSYPYYLDPIERTGKASDSNAIFATLIPDYISDENIFGLAGSAYSRPGPDNNMNSGRRLEAGENEWSYIIGLSDTSNGSFPLIVSGCAPGGRNYVTDESQPGGVWEGKDAIVVNVDISANIKRCKSRGQTAFIPRDDFPTKNLLEPDPSATPPWLTGQDVEVLNPKPGTGR